MRILREKEGRLPFLKFHAEAHDHPAAKSLSTRLGIVEIVNWLPSTLAPPHTLVIAHHGDGWLHSSILDIATNAAVH